jgi:hypothetical protein
MRHTMIDVAEASRSAEGVALARSESGFRGRARMLQFLVAASCAAFALLAPWSTSASAKLAHPHISSFGSFTNIQSVSVDQSTGDVYVYDSGAEAIFRYDAAGNPVEFPATKTNEITGVPSAGSGEGEIAVDSDVSSPAKGDIYVAHGSSANVLIYGEAGDEIGEIDEEAGKPWGEACGVAVGSDGDVYVGLYPEYVNKYVPTASPVTDADYTASMAGLNAVCNVAADSAGNVFAATWSSGPITRYEPSQFGSLSVTGSVVDGAGSTLAVDPSNDDVYVDEGNQVAQFGPHGEPFEDPEATFASAGATSGSYGIAVNEKSGSIYVSDGNGEISVFGPSVMLPEVTTTSASHVSAKAATLAGTVDPEGLSIEECYFEYGESTAYGQMAPCSSAAVGIGSGTAPVEVTAELSGLRAAVYHYRLVATNQNGASSGADHAFSTIPPAVEEESVADVSATAATLLAKVNPQGSATTYRFEYGTSGSYGATAPVAEGEAGSGSTAVGVEVHIQSLSPSTTYHYRLVARNGAGAAEGVDQTFTSEGGGGPLTLLDARQWELVSPPNKHGALIEAGRGEGGAIQAAADGSGIVYYASAPVTGEELGSRSPEATSVLSRRGATGWETEDLSVPHDEPNNVAVGHGTEYKAFSQDLSRGLFEPYDLMQLTPETTEWTWYMRENQSRKLRPLVTASNDSAGTKFGGLAEGGNEQLQFEGASPDLTHVVLSSQVPLTENTTGPGLYEWYEGQLQLISILPGAEETPAAEALVGDNRFQSGREMHAISTDGSRIVFASNGHLYLRDVALKQTVQLDAGASTAVASAFQVANPDDSKIVFTAGTALAPGAIEDSINLYQCTVKVVAGDLTCELSDLAPGEPGGDVVGASEDLSYVYAAGTEIQVIHGGAVTHIETGAGFFDTQEPIELMARVSPNGRYFAFMSTGRPTGYDNRDAVSGEPDTEVYLYDAVSKDLACVSCNPTGARPRGFEVQFNMQTLVNARGDYKSGIWLSGSVPGWVGIGGAGDGRPLHQPRYLNDRGQVFFNSAEALVPQDVNGMEDVYEHEPDGAGDCEKSGGCVELISAGTSQEESMFMDASEMGGDVFFVTSEPLVSKDYDHAFDVYDAHECTVGVPCTSEPVSPPPCESGDSCKGAPSAQPAVFGAPASAIFSGAGNLTSQTSEHAGARKAGGKKKQKETMAMRRALKRCVAMHKRNRHELSGCRRRAKERLRMARRAAAPRQNGKASGRGSGL